MKYSIPVKFLAILMTALALAVTFISALGIVQAVREDLYTQDPAQWSREQIQNSADNFGITILEQVAIREHTTCTQEELECLNVYTGTRYMDLSKLSQEDYCCVVYNAAGEAVYSQGDRKEGMEFTVSATVGYPVIVQRDLSNEYMQNLISEDDGLRYRQKADNTWFSVRYAVSPEYTAVVTVNPEAALQEWGTSMHMIEVLYAIRYTAIITMALGLLIFAAGAAYLCWAAGKSATREGIRPGGLNRTPLDLYLAIATGLFILALIPAFEIIEDWFYSSRNFNPGFVTIALSLLTADAVIFVGFCFACAAQFKTKDFFWWRHSVVGFCLGKLWHVAIKIFRFVRQLVEKTVVMLPLTWRWLLTAAGMGIMILLGVVAAFNTGSPGLLLIVLFGCLAITLYGAYAFGSLRAGAKRMAEGDLYSKVNSKYLVGEYALCAKDLNALADVAVVAAKNQMKSDRMKTELITNVSHDIKTPLTSIINYVDLLEKPHTEEEGRQYLEVLHRQSQSMKKLIEDLMEMSKATTGNMTVDITQVDAGEAVNQALGEFADKLEKAGLTPVFRYPEEPVAILADGRLTWRVLSNLLSNVVKYALPGTRLYIDLIQLESQVVISLKNISREELNISADELTERFVRGDASRNTEGSGLGLNIAQSLMELQKGQLQLLVDGDLFKVTLLFPKA